MKSKACANETILSMVGWLKAAQTSLHFGIGPGINSWTPFKVGAFKATLPLKVRNID